MRMKRASDGDFRWTLCHVTPCFDTQNRAETVRGEPPVEVEMRRASNGDFLDGFYATHPCFDTKRLKQ
jgi:hypothetical protein